MAKYDGDEEWGKLPKRAGNTRQLQRPTTTVAADCGKRRAGHEDRARETARPTERPSPIFLFLFFFPFWLIFFS